MSRPYYELPGLENIYLEDSYVLAIQEAPGRLIFQLDTVLTDKHSAYEPPKSDDYYCFRKGVLEFNKIEKLEWLRKTMDPATDADGQVDYGNIDTFFEQDGVYELTGTWGSIRVRSAPPTFRLTKET